MKQYNKPKKIKNILRPGLYRDDPLATIGLPQRSHSSQSLGKYRQVNQNNQNTEHIPTQINMSTSAVVIHYEEALYQVYAPLPLPFVPHPARKWSESILTTLEPTQGVSV